MRLPVELLLAAALGAPAQAPQQEEPPHASCVVCHGAEGLQHARGVHAGAGVGCIECHGGRAGVLDETAHGDDLRPLRDPLESVESCGGCHADPERMRAFGLRTDPLPLYWTSRHGLKLAEDGDPNVATCVSCHGAHGVLSSVDPRSPAHPFNAPETCGRCHADEALMAGYGLSATVVDDYRGSVHGRALLEDGHLSSPTCADCHGTHGALPPRVGELGQVCGHCHSVVRESFERGAHASAVRSGKMQECTSCHAHHDVRAPSSDMFVGSAEGHCGSCHASGDPGARAAAELHAGLSELDELIRSTEEALATAAARGVFIDSEHGYLEEAEALRVRAAALTHTVSPPELEDLLNRGAAMIQQTEESLDVKMRALRDRKIFTGIFLGVVLVLAGVLLRYRSAMARGWKPARGRV